jgi:hypothetical protein
MASTAPVIAPYEIRERLSQMKEKLDFLRSSL